MLKKILIFLLPVCLLVSAVYAEQIQVKKPPLTVFVKPDIVVENIKVSSKPWYEPGKVR